MNGAMNLISEALDLGWKLRRRTLAGDPQGLHGLVDRRSADESRWHGELLPVPRDLLERLSAEIAQIPSMSESMKQLLEAQTAQHRANAEKTQAEAGLLRNNAEDQQKITGAMRGLVDAAAFKYTPEEGLKLDDGKLELWEFFTTFGLAIEAAARHAQWGISVGNRGWANQRKLPIGRYYSAFMRHVLAVINRPEVLDEHGKEHWDAILWNVLEIVQRRELEKGRNLGLAAQVAPAQTQGVQSRYKATNRYSVSVPPDGELQAPGRPST